MVVPPTTLPSPASNPLSPTTVRVIRQGRFPGYRRAAANRQDARGWNGGDWLGCFDYLEGCCLAGRCLGGRGLGGDGLGGDGLGGVTSRRSSPHSSS
ncbi:MAG: hypothetical protein AW07_03918 [Candidatus Accumulibacter sp. SK-11]|nr:MAG: hypothetical protein AW07_03918 [Candidatus Accumulibacter sp. SK-11]